MHVAHTNDRAAGQRLLSQGLGNLLEQKISIRTAIRVIYRFQISKIFTFRILKENIGWKSRILS